KESVSWHPETPERLMAPIDRDDPVGQAIITVEDRVLKSMPLVADREIPRAGVFKRSVHTVALLSIDHGKGLLVGVLLIGGVAGLLLYMKRKQSRPKHRRRQ
ncbi:MAG: hypothetical protein ACLFVT_05515, partial [Syntrophobacteria bacterium]